MKGLANPRGIKSPAEHPERSSLTDFRKRCTEFVTLTVIYYVVARASLLLAFQNTNASPVWPPSGIAFAALLVWGYRLGPAVWLGAFLANFLSLLDNGVTNLPSLIVASVFIGAGNMLEALTGTFLTRRWVGLASPLDRVRDTFKFVAIIFLACLTSSVIGPTSLCLLGIVPWPLYQTVWFTWWLGDAVGVLVFTPVLLTFLNWYRQPAARWEPRCLVEVILLNVSVFMVAWGIFGGSFPLGRAHYPTAFLTLPFILWSAFRFGQGGISTSTLILSGTALWGTLKGFGPFIRASQNESLLLLQAFIGTVAVTGFSLTVLLKERRAWEGALRKTYADLENRVQERTTQLREINEFLKKEITERKRAEEKIQTAYQELEKSQEAALNIMEDLERQKRELHKSNEALTNEIAERKRVEEALRVSESRFRRLAESNIIGIILTDLKGRIIDANEAFLRMVGYSRDELRRGQVRSDEMTPPEWHELDEQATKQIRLLGIATPFEKEYFRKDKSRVPILVGAALLEGTKEECICFVLDLTEHKRAEEARKELARKELELARIRAEREQLELFAFVASHDLQEPLHKIINFGDLLKLQTQNLDAKSQDYVERMQNAAARMSRLIHDLLNFLRTTTHVQPFERISLTEIVNEVVKDLEHRVKESGADILVGELPTLEADRAQIHQLFQNLISNSLKFRKKDEPLSIRINRQEAEPGFVAVMVQDNGIGLDEKYGERIFKPFERLHTQKEYEGSGVGLAICKKIVLRHGGGITVKSKEGAGATFIIKLPVAPFEKEEREISDGRDPATAAPRPFSGGG